MLFRRRRQPRIDLYRDEAMRLLGLDDAGVMHLVDIHGVWIRRTGIWFHT